MKKDDPRLLWFIDPRRSVGFPSLLALKAYGLQALRAEKENDTSIHMYTLVSFLYAELQDSGCLY